MPHRTPSTAPSTAPAPPPSLAAGQARPAAVLLNANAKKVGPAAQRAIGALVGEENVFLSHDLDEAERIVERVLTAGYPTVFAAGGDGTFVAWVNRIVAAAERMGRQAPRFGVLPLGTGNAVASWVGTSPRTYLADLGRCLSGGLPGVRHVDLISCEGRHTPFAGVGADAAIVNDYNWLRQRLRGTPLGAIGQGATGYGLAVALRSAPRFLVERAAHCEVVNAGGPAWRLDETGRRVGRPIAAGDLLYAGPCMMAAGSTIPFYGMGIRAFPFAAEAPGTMQLRLVSRVPVPTVLLNLPRIWSGEFTHAGLHDFQVDRVTLRFDRPLPLQVGGDAEGLREALTLAVEARPIEVVDFGAPRA